MLANKNIDSANTPQSIYQSPAGGKRTVFSANFTNRQSSAVVVSIFLVNAGTAADSTNAIEWSVTIPANSSLERAGLVLKANQTLWALCTTANAITAVVYGIEE